MSTNPGPPRSPSPEPERPSSSNADPLADTDSSTNPPRPACPACGGRLIEVRAKLVCSRCRTICETCCEGGRTEG